jgi:hypothetical protein
MSFFERYFAALDGPQPHSSLDLVADDLQFSIHWSDGERSREFVGGRDELQRFIDAGDTTGWAHHVLWSAQADDAEFALGETRWEDGRRIGTFVAVAQLGEDGRMVRYLTARSPVIEFATDGRGDG